MCSLVNAAEVMAEEQPHPVSPKQLWCAVCFATMSSPDEQVYREPQYPQTAFHLDHVFDKRASLKCYLHRSEVLSLHCKHCGTLMCYKCSVQGEHCYHKYRRADTKFEQLKRALEPLQDESAGVLLEASQVLAQLNESEEKLTQHKFLVQTEVERKFHHILELLESKKKDMLSQLEDLSLEQEKSIADVKGILCDVRVSVSGCLDSVKRNLSMGSMAGVSELVSTARKDLSKHKFEAKILPDIQCVASCEELSGCLKTWKVYTQDVCSDKSYAEGDGVNRATLNKATEFAIYTRNYDNETCDTTPPLNVECELVHESSGASVKGSAARSEGGRYLVSYTPRLPGSSLLSVRIESQDIRGSPFEVTVRDMRSPIATITDVEGPWGVAINHRGQTIVSENKGNCISMFDSERKKINLATNSSQVISFLDKSTTKSCDTEVVGSLDLNVHLNHPSEVAVDEEGNILVANRHEHTVIKFQADGTFVKAVGMGNSLKKEFFYPTGIAVHPINKKVYVTDTLNHRIRVLNSDLTDDQMFGKYGDQKGAEFVYPTSVACDSTGRVYVVDSGNNRVKIFTAEGTPTPVDSFGHSEHRDKQLNRPVGIAIDEWDRLYISDRGNHRICVFTCEGVFMSSFYSTADDSFDPSALAVDGRGVLYVCSYKQGNVQLFHV